MSDTGENVGPVAVDPDEQQFRADTLLMHAELTELELYAIRRWLFQDPSAVKVNVGAGNPAEQTIRGYQRDPFNGVIVYNPTPATLALGFQAGLGLLAPATVPPFSFATFPERYVNLSVAVLNPADQALAIALPVTLLRTKIPPPPAAGAFGLPVPGQPLTSLPAGSAAAGAGAVLDNGIPRSTHSLIVTAAGAPTAGAVSLQVSNDGVNWATVATTAAINAAGSYSANVGNFPARYVRAAVTTAITGGTVLATVASS